MSFIDPDEFVDPDEAPQGAEKSPDFLDYLMGAPRKGHTSPTAVKTFREAARGSLGSTAAMYDIAQGALKFPATWLAASYTNVTRPKGYNTDEIRSAANEAAEQKFPSLGNTLGVQDTLGYRAPMLPFEAISHVVDYAGNTTGRLTDSKDVAGTVKLGLDAALMVGGIPGAKTAGKLARKGIEVIDPGLRNTKPPVLSSKEISDTVAQDKFKKEQPQGTLFVDPDAVASPELATKIKEDPAVIEHVKQQQAQELQNVAKEATAPKNEQLDLFTPDQRQFDFTFERAAEPPVDKPTSRDIPSAVVKDKQGNDYTVSVSKQAFGVDAKTPNSVLVEIRDPVSGERRGMVDFAIREDGTLIAENAKVAPDYRGRGLAEQMYQAARDAGYDIAPGRVQTDMGYSMVKSLQKKGIINKESNVPRFRAGDLDLAPIEGERIPGERTMTTGTTLSGPLEVIPIAERTLKDDITTPRSEETIAARDARRSRAEVLQNMHPGLKQFERWTDVKTLEEALSLAKDAKDISKDFGTRQLASGIQGVTISNRNSPVLRYMRKLAGDMRAMQSKFSQDFITNKQDGLVNLLKELPPESKIKVMEMLMQEDKQQHRLGKEIASEVLTKQEHAFYIKAREALDQLITVWNDVRKQLGFKPVYVREGYFPGRFTGSYKLLVTDKEGKIIGVPTADTKWQLAAAREWYKKNHPDARFSEVKRSDLGKYNKADTYSGLKDVLVLLAKNDPKMAELLSKSQDVQKLINNDLFSISNHELQKKGITGSQGNKPWLDREQNAKEALQSLVDHLEQGIEHHSMQIPLHELDKLLKAEETAHLPNTRKYLQQYKDHITNKTGDLGMFLNRGIDVLFAQAWGLGPKVPIRLASSIKAGMSRMFMAYNPMFVAAQLAQPFQIAFPLAFEFAQKLGVGEQRAMQAMSRGHIYGLSETLSKMFHNDKVSIAPEYIKEAIQYAHDRGLYAFNEQEIAHHSSKNKYVQAPLSVTDYTISVGDRVTKLPVFLGYVELLVSHGVDKNTAFAIAEKGTETSMINYHPNERPMLYSKLGVLGQFAGGLTTYKHGSINALAHLTQEAKNPRKAIPIASAALVMLILAGITGTPGYQELDQLYSKISEHIKGEPSTIRQDFLKNIPEWVKSGAISSATNLNMQAKWSAADMVPDSLFKAASPHLEAAGQIVNKIVTYLSDPSETNKANLLMAASPSSLKGFTEEKFKKDSQGRVLDYQGLPKFTDPRSEENWNKRKYFGVGLLDETVKGEELYKQRQAQVFKEKKIAEKSKQVKQAYIDKDFMRGAKLMAEYEKLAGPEAQQALMQELMDKTLPVDTNLGQKERYQGTPKNLQGVKKYENYNKGN